MWETTLRLCEVNEVESHRVERRDGHEKGRNEEERREDGCDGLCETTGDALGGPTSGGVGWLYMYIMCIYCMCWLFNLKINKGK